MKKMVKISANDVNSHFGIVIDECNGAFLIKVPCKEDWMEWLETPHSMILGSDFVAPIPT